MCGIIGFIAPSGLYTKNVLIKMSDSLVHRGPDASDHHFYESELLSIGLGHRRLSIIDLSESANQPMYSKCGRYIIDSFISGHLNVPKVNLIKNDIINAFTNG